MKLKNKDVSLFFTFPNGKVKQFMGWDENDNLIFIHQSGYWDVETYSEKEIENVKLTRNYYIHSLKNEE